ncbi:hypothetical protein Tco_0496671 [Tanacetum coccineum]
MRGCKALEFIQPPASSSTTTNPTPPTKEWLTVDSIIKSWIYMTIFDQLLERVLKCKPKTARDAWEFLEKILKDNKRSKMVELVGELRSLDIGDLTVEAYFRKIDSLATRLDNLGSNITEDDLVTFSINGLSGKYNQVAHVIINRDPFSNLETFPSVVYLETFRSVVSLAETRLNRRNNCFSSSRISPYSTTALISQTGTSRSQDSQQVQHGKCFDTQETNLPLAFSTLTLKDSEMPGGTWTHDENVRLLLLHLLFHLPLLWLRRLECRFTTDFVGLVPYLDSDSNSSDKMDSPEYITPLPATSPFLYTDSHKASDSSDGPPSHDPYVTTVAH